MAWTLSRLAAACLSLHCVTSFGFSVLIKCLVFHHFSTNLIWCELHVVLLSSQVTPSIFGMHILTMKAMMVEMILVQGLCRCQLLARTCVGRTWANPCCCCYLLLLLLLLLLFLMRGCVYACMCEHVAFSWLMLQFFAICFQMIGSKALFF